MVTVDGEDGPIGKVWGTTVPSSLVLPDPLESVLRTSTSDGRTMEEVFFNTAARVNDESFM